MSAVIIYYDFLVIILWIMKFLPNCILNNYKILIILGEFYMSDQKLSGKLLFQQILLMLLIFYMVQLIILYGCHFSTGTPIYFTFASLAYNIINVIAFSKYFRWYYIFNNLYFNGLIMVGKCSKCEKIYLLYYYA